MEIQRKNLDNDAFLRLRQATERISKILFNRLRRHLDIIKPLFIPAKLLGVYVKTQHMEDVIGSDKAFAELQERYAELSSKSYGLHPKLQHPLPPISNQLEVTPYQYPIHFESSKEKKVIITSPTRWIVAYQSACPLSRFKSMLTGEEARQDEELKRCICDHLVFQIFLERFSGLRQLLEDLRYSVEVTRLTELGDLPVVVLKAPLFTFLPPDSFIMQVTQLSGIPAFQEIIDHEELERISDPLKGLLIDR